MLQSLRCQACKMILKEPPIIVGQSEEERQAACMAIILQHFDTNAIREHQDPSPASRKPHMAAASTLIGNAMLTAKTWLTLRLFDLPEWMEPARDRARHNIHSHTHKRKLSDADLEKLAESMGADIAVLEHMRDFYEETGRYRPAWIPEPAPAAAPAEVKL